MERSGALIHMQEAGAMWHGVAGVFAIAGVSFFTLVSPGKGQETEAWQLEGVLTALQDRDEAVWIRALDTLGEFELTRSQRQELVSDARYQNIINFLADTQSDTLQSSALRAIAVAGQAAAPTTALKILPLLQDSDGVVRQAAIDALSQLQARNHLSQILPHLRDRDTGVQEATIRAVGRLGGAEHASHLQPFLHTFPKATDRHRSPLNPVEAAPVDLRLATVRALAELGANNYSADLMSLLLNSNPELRQAASKAIGQLDARDRIPDLLRLLEDPRWQAREAASQTLGYLDATSAIPHVTTLLNHPSWPVRQIAIQTLVRLDARGVRSSIASLLAAPEAEVRAAAVEALGQLEDTSNSERLLSLLRDDAVIVREAAITAIGQLGNREQLGNQERDRAVALLLEDRDSTVRQATLYTLAQLNARETLPQMIPLLRDRGAGVRKATIVALGNLEAYNALPQLLPLLQDDSAAVQQAAGEVVSQLLQGEPTLEAVTVEGNRTDRHRSVAISTVLGLLQHRQWSVRQVGVQVLGDIDIPERLPQILSRLRDRRQEVRQTAISTWEQLAPHSIPTIVKLLESTYDLPYTDQAHTDRAQLRFLAYYGSGGHPEAIAAIQWLGKPSVRPNVGSINQRVHLLEQLYLLWPRTAGNPHLRSDMAQLMAQLVSNGDWTSGWIQERHQQSLLTKLDMRLRQDGFITQANTIRTAHSGLPHKQYLKLLRRYLIGHAITWLMLWLLYPLCLPIQILVWHPWLRRILGHGYVGWLLSRVPVLRARLLVLWQAGTSSSSFSCNALSCDGHLPYSPLRSTGAIEQLDLYNYRHLEASSTFPTCDWPQRDHQSSSYRRSKFHHSSISRLPCAGNVVLVAVDAEACERGVEAAIRGVVARTVALFDLDPAFFTALVRTGGFAICIQHFEHGSALAVKTIRRFADRRMLFPPPPR